MNTQTSPASRRLGIREFHRLVWTHGGTAARRLYVFFWGTVTLLLMVIGLMFAVTLANLVPFEVLFSWGLAAMTAGAYIVIISPPFFDAGVWEELLRTNRFAGEERNIREWMRFLASVGKRGQAPGFVAWAVASWVLYYLMMAVAIVFAYVLLPSLGSWTPYVFAGVDAAVTAGWFVAWYLWQRRMAKDAEARGFHVMAERGRRGWPG